MALKMKKSISDKIIYKIYHYEDVKSLKAQKILALKDGATIGRFRIVFSWSDDGRFAGWAVDGLSAWDADALAVGATKDQNGEIEKITEALSCGSARIIN